MATGGRGRTAPRRDDVHRSVTPPRFPAGSGPAHVGPWSQSTKANGFYLLAQHLGSAAWRAVHPEVLPSHSLLCGGIGGGKGTSRPLEATTARSNAGRSRRAARTQRASARPRPSPPTSRRKTLRHEQRAVGSPRPGPTGRLTAARLFGRSRPGPVPIRMHRDKRSVYAAEDGLCPSLLSLSLVPMGGPLGPALAPNRRAARSRSR
jgi:hypothetical protein